MRFTLKETRLGLRNSRTRIPFRYGGACLTRCPQAVLAAVIETTAGVHAGYSGDCLPPLWFDKTPTRGFREQIADMVAAVRMAEEEFVAAAGRPVPLFDTWLGVYNVVHAKGRQRGFNPLLTSFGLSMVERAVMDALARAAQISFHAAVHQDLYEIEPGKIHASLAGLKPTDWLPDEPSPSVFVRHTVGLGDPLTAADIAPEDHVGDGFPQALEEYVEQAGVRYVKVKMCNDLARDKARLLDVAKLLERHRGSDYRLTIDGNEQYHQADEFDALVNMLRTTPELKTLFDNIFAIEQPLERKISLDAAHTAGIRRLSGTKPVIIDESDGELTSFAEALELGYRGVSSKNCKGPIKSLLNAGLCWLKNDRGERDDYVITGEDLCSVGVIPVQADLCLAATLGLENVERNGHHYHPGLSYLPEPSRRAALAAHPDFYAERHGIIAPAIQDGRFQIASLQCIGFGFAVEPDLDAYEPPEEWRYESLGFD